MKKLTTLSLFIFWAVIVSIFTASLIYYQNHKNSALSSNGTSQSNNSTSSAVNNGSPTTLSSTEIAKHNSSGDCWLLINNKVYDVTSFLSTHPGGADTILQYCGQEATQAFNTKDIGRPHSAKAAAMLNDYYIGNLNQKLNQQQIQQNLQNTN